MFIRVNESQPKVVADYMNIDSDANVNVAHQ